MALSTLRNDEGIINLNQNRGFRGFRSTGLPLNITGKEESAIISAVSDITGFHDLQTALYKLRWEMNADKYQHCLEQFSDTDSPNKEQVLLFIYEVLEVEVSELPVILRFVDFSVLAKVIESNLRGGNCRGIGHAKLKSGSHSQHVFYNHKSLCDDNSFACRKSYFDKMLEKNIDFIDSYNSEDTNPLEKEVNNLAINTWLRVQQCERSDDIRELIDNMLQHIPVRNRVDLTIVHFVHQSKLAVACELDGDSERADEHIQNAVDMAFIYSDPLTTSLLMHDKRYVRQLRYMRRRTDVDWRDVQNECCRGLDFFSSIDTELCRFMNRIMRLYTVHNFLRIGQNFEMDLSEDVSPDNIDKAASILEDLGRCFRSGLLVEQRRKMIYFVLKARLHELRGEIQESKSFLSSAYNLMSDGTFFVVEKLNLAVFYRRLFCS